MIVLKSFVSRREVLRGMIARGLGLR